MTLPKGDQFGKAKLGKFTLGVNSGNFMLGNKDDYKHLLSLH